MSIVLTRSKLHYDKTKLEPFLRRKNVGRLEQLDWRKKGRFTAIWWTTRWHSYTLQWRWEYDEKRTRNMGYQVLFYW